MLAHRTHYNRFIIRLIRLLFLVIFLTACQGNTVVLPVTTNTQSPPSSAALEYPKAEVTFIAHLPTKLDDDQNLYLEILDEVTGLALNAARVQMSTTDHQTFTLHLPITAGSIFKYRYLRDKDPIGLEYTSLGKQVRYRLLSVTGPITVEDTITSWKFSPMLHKLGRIQGQVAYKANNAPVVNALVTAGGMHTLTASDGTFLLEGLPEGLHNLVIYSLDGAFRPFQQGAVIADDSTTPALALVEPNKLVNVTFIVTQPDASLKGVPIRLVGNIYPLGNTFADLRGGISAIASRAPLLAFLPDGRYSITIKLPAGFDLRYKYSLGDGFWNTERSENGDYRLRQLIVPDRDTTVDEAVVSWRTPGLAPLTFTVTVPPNTPKNDTVSIQFNPFSWTEPIPMWPLGNNRWFYLLYNPLDGFSKASYRYCRNDQCGTADAIDTRSINPAGIAFTPQNTPQDIQDEISAWAWSEGANEPLIVPATPIGVRDSNFIAGVELMPAYHPSWQSYMPAAFQNISGIGSNTVILTPTWHLTHNSPPVMELVPGRDPLWSDMTLMANQAHQKGLAVVIRPTLKFDQDSDLWWQSAPRDDGWWQSWFDRYQTYILYHADLAAQSGAKALILGDENILPALPGGTLIDGSPSRVSGNAEKRWSDIITAIRSRYTGKLLWLVPYTGDISPVPTFVSKVDQLYLQLAPPFAETDQLDQAGLEAAVAAVFDDKILKLQEETNQPIVIGLRYPSVRGAFDGCVESDGDCLPAGAFNRPVPEYAGVEIALREQADVYGAVMSVINQRSWISGFFAVGYYPPAEIKDDSVSVHSKPASNILWYWYPRLLGKVTP
jgi:hypothetical protein